jgi:prophage DNA circulation protein
MSEARFDISLPSPYKEKWREAYRADKEDNPRLSSYQSPNGEPIPFIYKSLDFSGGQSVDTAEYPFFGLWSNEALNQKTQTITVHGYLRGEYYLQQRADFLDALMIPTSDDTPGFFDHPLWGRFKVVVESYNITESANENGQCELTLTLKRAGVSLESRAQGLKPQYLVKPKDTAGIAAGIFAKNNADYKTLLQGFGVIKTQLLAITGALQLPRNIINGITNEITGIANLIAQGVQSPILLAQALVNAVFSIAAAVVSVEESPQAAGKYLSGQNNKKAAALNFLSAGTWTLPIEAATVRQDETKRASENLYRAVSLCAAAEIIMSMEDATRGQMDGYWALYTKLENSISLEDPDMYEAIVEMRSALSENLRQSNISHELKKTLERPVPLLFLSHYLNCDEDQLRILNAIEDSLLVSGEVIYV